MSIEDSGVASGSDAAADLGVEQSVIDNINATFSEADPGELEPVGQEAEAAPTPDRSKANRQEQAEELEQEGTEGETSEEGKVEEEPADETPADEQVIDAAVEPLDPNLRFAAQQFGWTDDKIDALHAANPEMAVGTFQNLLSAFQNLSRQQLVPQAQNPAAQAAAAQQQQSKFEKLIGNLKQFEEVNGEPLGEMLRILHEEVYQPLRQIQAEYQVQKQQAVAAEATTTTGSLSEKFPDFYGKDDKLTLVHQQNRASLYQIADQLRSGAHQQGKDMSVRDAINRAHLIVTADMRVAEGRKQVAAQVTKRSKSITARPTQRVNPKSAGVSKGDGAAMEAYVRRATELGISADE